MYVGKRDLGTRMLNLLNAKIFGPGLQADVDT